MPSLATRVTSIVSPSSTVRATGRSGDPDSTQHARVVVTDPDAEPMADDGLVVTVPRSNVLVGLGERHRDEA